MSLSIKFTQAGLAALVNPANVGTRALEITHIELGRGHYDPDGSETNLVDKIKSLSTFGGEVVAADMIHVTLRDDSSDSYNVGEIGLRTGDGILLGVISSKDTSVITQKGPNDVLLISVDAAVTEGDVTNLTFGNTDFIYNPASTEKKGVVQLSSQLTSDSELQAATSKAVKTLKGHIDAINTLLSSDKTSLDTLQEIVDFVELNRADLDALTITAVAGLQSALNAKANVSHGHGADDLPSATTSSKGVVQLSSSTSSTSEATAATSRALDAVKDAKADVSHGHGADDLPSATTSSKGVVQLSSSISSTSATTAANSGALKAVKDAKADKEHEHVADDLPSASTSEKGAVQLSSSVGSGSETIAATSKAVQTLKGYIDSINVLLTSDETSLDTLQEIVNFVELNRSDLDALTITGVAGLQGALNAKANSSHNHSAGDIPSATTNAKGVVKLSTSISSADTTTAATSSAVKAVKDSKANSSHSHGAGDLPSASTSGKGAVQLTTSTSSTSTTLVPTASALKAVKDSKANSSHSHGSGDLPSATTSAKGAVQLSTSTSSTSTSKAATSSAVKAVKDALSLTASKSSTGSLSNVTNSYNREVTASEASNASGKRSQVNVSYQGIASGQNSQVNASSGSLASGSSSQVNVSYEGDATYYYCQVNASSHAVASGQNSQVNCSTGGEASKATAGGHRSQINGSVFCSIGDNGQSSQINGSSWSNVSGYESQINASSLCSISGNNSTISASASCEMLAFRASIIASHGVSVASTKYDTLSMGFGTGEISTANRKIALESRSGAGRFNGNTYNSGADYAEYFENYEKGIIPDGSIITLVDKDTVRIAKTGDKILGVLSTSPSVTGNAPHSAWPERYLKNDFGRLLTEPVAWVSFRNEEGVGYHGPVSRCAVEIPSDAKYFEQDENIENPDYNPGGEYCERWDRPEEWSVVGLLGQLMVRVYENINTEFVSADGHSSTEPTRLELMFMYAPFDAEKGYAVAKCLLR